MAAVTKKAAQLAVGDLAALQKDMLPDEARSQLGMLVTELGGIGRVLSEIPGDEDHDLLSAVSMWVDRIAHDLGEMECRRYPGRPTEPSR